MTVTTIRAYERGDLPLDERLASLARRFPCLENAAGLDPWDGSSLLDWIGNRGQDDPAYHAGHLLLNLANHEGCPPFDVMQAAKIWGEQDRQTFIDWLRVWRF